VNKHNSNLNVPVKSLKNVWTTIIAVVITAIIVGGGVYAWQKSIFRSTEQFLQQQIANLQNQITNLQKLTQPIVTAPEKTQEPTQPTDGTAGWKTYQNKELGFELKMPSYVLVDKESNDSRNRFVVFKGEKENFDVNLQERKNTSLDQYYYLDFIASSKSILGGKEALVVEAPNGYCDVPGCGDPFIAYSTKNGDDFYNLVFGGDVELSNTEKLILSSFRFIK
jgi:type II secretory pathway pseudopilin PulG